MNSLALIAGVLAAANCFSSISALTVPEIDPVAITGFAPLNVTLVSNDESKLIKRVDGGVRFLASV